MKNLHQDQRGQQLVVMALLMPILIACLAFTVDLGNVYVRHRMAQNAADASSSAGVTVLLKNGQTSAQAVAMNYANQNGYDNDGTTNTVQFTFPGNCIHATVTDYVPPILVAIIWSGTFTVKAEGRACDVPQPLPFSIIVLDPSAPKALELTGGAEILTPNGNIHVNSDKSNAVNMSGGATITTKTPSTIVGGYSGSGMSPLPITGAAFMSDPLADLPEPSTASCPSSGKLKITGSQTLSPGCYMGGIELSGSANVTMLPGIYLIGGKGLKLSGSSSMSGSDVGLYIADGDVDMSGGSTFNMTPPSSGIYEGISFFQSRSNTAGMKFTGGSALSGVRGTIYSANGDVELSGSAVMQANFAVHQLKLSGGSSLTVNGFESTNWARRAYILSE